AFISKTLTLPLEFEIKDHFDPVDAQAIHQARQFLEQEIGARLKNSFLNTIDMCSKADPLSISHSAVADRSLKNLCLSYLGSLNEKETTDLIWSHFLSAKNMTDELASFKILADIDPDTKQKAADHFYAKWQHEKLVLDKWFMVQAGSSLSDTLDRVKDLVGHPDFSLKNPNKVRSLINMFAIQNHVNFHTIDGSGYRFIADQIIILDQINHQVAARLTACFNHWKKYDAQRQSLMKSELERILQIKSISKNVYEIVSRALE
ncbi:MAG: aminopeptidase N C-terminal domain-containing protein, partial [Desulfobacula sp.]